MLTMNSKSAFSILLPRLIATFSPGNALLNSSVLSVKGTSDRDVVSSADLAVDRVVKDFALSVDSTVRVLSEEGAQSFRLGEGDGAVLVVDPLDGSNNFVRGSDEYGVMVTSLKDWQFDWSLAVYPSGGHYAFWSRDGLILSPELRVRCPFSGASTYLAHAGGSSLGDLVNDSFWQIVEEVSGGHYRYGSSCAALFNLLEGRHAAFVGIRMHVWDVLSLIAITSAAGLRVRWCMDDERISLVISWDSATADSLIAGVKQAQTSFEDFDFDKRLV